MPGGQSSPLSETDILKSVLSQQDDYHEALLCQGTERRVFALVSV